MRAGEPGEPAAARGPEAPAPWSVRGSDPGPRGISTHSPRCRNSTSGRHEPRGARNRNGPACRRPRRGTPRGARRRPFWNPRSCLSGDSLLLPGFRGERNGVPKADPTWARPSRATTASGMYRNRSANRKAITVKENTARTHQSASPSCLARIERTVSIVSACAGVLSSR